MKPWPILRKRTIEIAAAIILFACLIAAAALFAQHMVQAALFRYPLDYGEAPLVDQALRLAAGRNIYRPNLDTPPYTIANYPPLYPLALAALVKALGPSFAAGRLISIACAVLTALLLGGIIRALTGDRIAAAVSGLLLLAFPFVLGWAKLARVDLLALALSMAGLYVLVRRPGRGGVIGAALLLVAAIYTRQSYALAAPLAAFIWLWTRSRRRAVGLAALVGGVSLALLLLLNALTGGGFFYNIITANVNEFRLDNLARGWRDLRAAAPVLLILGALYLVFGIRLAAPNRPPAGAGSSPAWPLLAPYLIGAALSALTIGKIGSNINYLLELCAALSLVAGAWVAASRAWSCSRVDSTSSVAAPSDKNVAEHPVAHTSPAEHPERRAASFDCAARTNALLRSGCSLMFKAEGHGKNPAEHPERRAAARSRRMRSGLQPGPHPSTTPVIVPTGSAQGASEVVFRVALLLVLAAQTVLFMRFSQRNQIPDLAWRLAQPSSDLAALEQIAAEADAPILADEFMGMLTLNDKPLYIQPFEVTQLAGAGLWDQTPLLADIRARAFPAVFIHHFPGYPVYQQRWTPEMLSAILAGYAPAAFLAETIVYRPRDPAQDPPADIAACPAAAWRLPTRSELGIWRRDGGLVFMGAGYERSAPVFAAADGRLTRDANWNDAVAIQHDDPLHPGQVIWTYYGGMASAWGGRSFVEPRFKPGSAGVPVKRGELLGYQGQYSARMGTPTWVHLEFTVLSAGEDGSFPATWAEGPETSAIVDPAMHLGIEGRAVTGQAVWLPLRCAAGAP